MVSIIVPIYNSGKYLRRCLESLKFQTYSNIEVLLIDDGSVDSSKEICEEYVNKYDFIKYFYKENSGVSSARNFGLSKSTGNYISFVDSDDWVEPTYIETLLNAAVRNQCEIAFCCRYIETGNGQTCFNFDDVDNLIKFKCERSVEFLPTCNHIYGSVWGVYTLKQF